MLVSWVTIGACLTRNHRAMSRRRLVKTMASPQPSRTRAATPASKVPAKANQNWPAVISVRPTSMSSFDP